MDTPGDFSTTLSQLGAWLSVNKTWIFSGIGVVVLGVLGKWLFIRPRPSNATDKGNTTSSASGDGASVTAINSNVNVQNSDPAVTKAIKAIKAIKALSRDLDAKDRQLEILNQQRIDAQQGEQGEKAAIKEAITALPNQTEISDAQARIKEALAAAAEGNTTLAEAIFAEVEARKVAEGKEVEARKIAEEKAARKSAYQEAAEAARHRGALAFLHDTDKAIATYRRATELDPENAVGWNQLGQLLYRTGALQDTEAAFRKVKALGKAADNQALLAIAYGNLGIVYQTRGDPDQAEAMYRKSLGLFQAIGARPQVEQVRGSLEGLR